LRRPAEAHKSGRCHNVADEPLSGLCTQSCSDFLRAEVAGLYVHDGHSKIDRPVHELKGFERIELQPGESKTVVFALDRDALSYWNPETKEWALDPGTFEVQVGASSRDTGSPRRWI
jgi:beta-glucosidase